MKKIQNTKFSIYSHPSYLVNLTGNNVFSYEKRINKTLRIAPIIDGDFDDIHLGSEPVFEDIDEKGILRSCSGLKNFIRMDWNGIPIILVDNHNHVLYFWYEARKNGIIEQKNTLIHIDQHSDLWENENNIPNNSDNLDEIFRFVNEKCNVGNYIQPAIRQGLIEKVVKIEGEWDIEKYQNYEFISNESLILNLDLDFFSPELDYIDFNKKKQIILMFARKVRLITIATSPFFIDYDRAIRNLRKVFEI